MSNPRDWHRKRKEHLVAYKGGKCVDCGGIFPSCCYDFDHKNPFEKSFGICEASSRGKVSLEELEKEVDKCDLVCANCHRIRTRGNEQIFEKMRAGLKELEPWNKGLKNPYSADTLAKMGVGQKKRFSQTPGPGAGRVWSPEARQRMSESHKFKGIKPSIEACRLGGQKSIGEGI